MSILAAASLMLQAAAPLPAPSAATAVQTCRAAMQDGACAAEWRGATFELRDAGFSSMTLVSPSGQQLTWSFNCQVDAVEETRSCSLSGGGGSVTFIRIFLRNGGLTTGVLWGGSKFPGSEKVAKIGSFAPMRWASEELVFDAKATRVIEAAKKGGPAIFRWYNWPEELAQDEKVNFDGFSLVWDWFKAASNDRTAS